MLERILERYEYDMLKCLYCGQCRHVCPTLRHEGWESTSPRGRVKMIYGWAKGEFEITESAMERLYECCGCEHCVVECPSGINIVNLIREARAEFVRLNGRAIEPLKSIDDRIIEKHNFLGRENMERMFWAEFEDLKLDENSKTGNLYFVGCLPSLWCIEDAASTAKILKAVNYDFKVLGGEEWCCGLIPLWSGEIEAAKEISDHNIEAIAAAEAGTVFTTCPGCHRTLGKDYSEVLGKEKSFRVLHLVELLDGLLEERKLEFKGEMRVKATYHDPCHIGRETGLFEEPRRILSSVPGLELLEMEKVKMDANCCGGLLAPISESLATKIGMDRVREALETGAEILVTSCPQCYTNLRNSAAELDADISVYTISMLLREAMGL